MAFDGVLPDRQEELNNLSYREKAMLFDLAIQAARAAPHSASPQAQMISAFARAYVLIRDREDGIV